MKVLEILRWICFAISIAGVAAVLRLAYRRSQFWSADSRREELDRPWSPSELRALKEKWNAADETEKSRG